MLNVASLVRLKACFDINRREITSKECSDFCKYDLNNIPKGIYLLKLNSADMNVVKKVIIDK